MSSGTPSPADQASPAIPRGPRAEANVDAVQRILARELSPTVEVLRLLARGRTSFVWLAREITLKRLVAVKVLAAELAQDEVARRRFEREATAAAALSHPNVVPLYRFGYLPQGLPYLVMQYVSGGTLEDRLAAEGPLPLDAARRTLSEVADALAAAHRHGFVHRDIRPANVLYDPETGRALVTDFGLAGVLPSGEPAGTRLTRTGEVLSSAEYASPEQLRGEGASERTDVYAFGVLGYRLVAGQWPYRIESEAGLEAAHLRAPPRDLTALRPGTPAALAALLRQCLAKDPRRRPTAEYIARALRERLGEGASGGDRDPGATGDLLESLLRRRLPQIVTATVVLGYAALSFVDQLADRNVIPELAYSIALTTFGYGVAASAVVAWFHGTRGKQRVSSLELGLLALLGVGWVVTNLMIVMI